VLNAVTGITGRYLAEKDRPTGIAIGTASIFAGMVLAFVLSALLPDGSDLPAVLRISAAFAVVAALAMIVALRKKGEHRAVSSRPDRSALRVTWGDPLIRRLCLLAIFPFGVFVAITTFAQALLEPAGVGGGTASTILLVNVVAGVVGSAVIPVLVVRRQAESTLLVTSLLVTALACAALALAPGVLVGFVAITAIGFLLLPALPIVLELVERRTGEADGTGAGLIWMAGNLGGLVVATVVGLLVDHPSAAFAVLAGVALVAVPGAYTLRRLIASL
jgi:predicted MFS family arabinose efflux permease